MKDQLFNRNILFSLMAVVMLLGWTAMSYGAATVSVDPATIESPAVGEQLTVNINIAGGEDVGGYAVDVNFDSTALSYVSIAYGEYLPKPALPGVDPVTISENKVGFYAFGNALDGDHTLATITFEVLEVKASAITLSDVLISGDGGTALEVTTADGSVTVPTTEETPTEETPTEETPTEETPTEETPTEETPTEETPTEETPTEETPTEETPTEETPTEETPTVVEEPTVEEPTVEEPTVVPEPVVPEPVVPEPVVPEPVVPEPVVPEPVVPEPVVPEPVVPEPVVPEPVVPEPVVPEPVVPEPVVPEPVVPELVVPEPVVPEPVVPEPVVPEPVVPEPVVPEPVVPEPVVPEPVVPEPVVPEPVVPEPVVPEPVVPEPVVPEPVVPEPVVPEPVVPEPVVPEPVVPEPVVPEPVVPEPVVPELVVPEPVVPEPVVPEPVVPEPVVPEPVVPEPVVPEPVVPEPVVPEPVVPEPVVPEPVVPEPVVPEPVVPEPVVPEPVVPEPVVPEPVVPEPVVPEPVVPEPVVPEPVVPEPVVPELVVPEPVVPEPVVPEPVVPEPVVPEPVVPEPVVPEPVVPEPVVPELVVPEPVVPEPVVPEPIVPEPVVPEPVVPEPVVPEPVVPELVVPEPVVPEPVVPEPIVPEPVVPEPVVPEPVVPEPVVPELVVPEPVVPEPVVPEPVVPEPQVFSFTLTNLTTGEPGMGGQIFSPPIFATHAAGLKLYAVGQPANAALVALAEGGDASGLAALTVAAGANTTVGEGMVLPGASVTVMLTADAMNSALSLATMLVSTNDAFIGTTDLALFDEAGMPISTTLELRSYDAGSEQNTERGTDIPGPVGLPADEDPMGSNARVPTEGGVITNHAGIQGVGDVAASFAWTEPTAMLMIAPYVPKPEVVPVEPPLPLPTYDVRLEAGLNMISVPLMPTEPYTAQSLAKMLGSTVVIKLNVATQSFVGYVAGIEGGYNFGIEGGKGYIVNTPAGGTVTFSGTAWSNEPAEMPTESAAAAPKISATESAWAFVIASNLQDKETGASYTMVAKNIRTGVTTTEKVSSEGGYVSAVWADLNHKSVVEAGDKIEIALLDERGTIVSGPFQRTVQTTDIHNAFMSVQMRVGDVRPKEAMLGQNFPNPFNPETWIPYQLNRDSNVTIQIFDVSGHSVRTLNIGHKSTGAYMTSSSAAYWDGKNAAGEHVSSGIYFYALQTQYFSATRRMVILK